MTIKKSMLKRLGMATVLVIVITAVLVGAALANQAVSIVTKPIHTNAAIYLELNNNGVHDSNELIGNFDVYDGTKPITFTWHEWVFKSTVNGSYNVTVWQNTTPLNSTATWVQTNSAHHWASNPNPTTFTFGALGLQKGMLSGYPTKFVVTPETYVLYKTDNGTYDYNYTPVGAAYTANLATDGEFVLETLVVTDEPEGKGGGGKSCQAEWNSGCQEICLSPECLTACMNAFGEFSAQFCSCIKEESDPLQCMPN